MSEEEEKIRFKDLSGWLKTAIVLLWILIVYDAILFIVGFALGFLGYV
jgi:hypothetical protein